MDTGDNQNKEKLHLGCGNQILSGFLNVDLAPLPGVDVVHDLTQMPWPFHEGQFKEIIAVHLLEHLPNTVKVVEELWRIGRRDARLNIRVPYWNSHHSIADPTHIKLFNHKSLDFFDPRKRDCKERPYYSKARFIIEKIYYWRPLIGEKGWIRIGNPVLKKIMDFFATYLNNIIWVLEFDLKVIK